MRSSTAGSARGRRPRPTHTALIKIMRDAVEAEVTPPAPRAGPDPRPGPGPDLPSPLILTVTQVGLPTARAARRPAHRRRGAAHDAAAAAAAGGAAACRRRQVHRRAARGLMSKLVAASTELIMRPRSPRSSRGLEPPAAPPRRRSPRRGGRRAARVRQARRALQARRLPPSPPRGAGALLPRRHPLAGRGADRLDARGRMRRSRQGRARARAAATGEGGLPPRAAAAAARASLLLDRRGDALPLWFKADAAEPQPDGYDVTAELKALPSKRCARRADVDLQQLLLYACDSRKGFAVLGFRSACSRSTESTSCCRRPTAASNRRSISTRTRAAGPRRQPEAVGQ